MKKSFIPIIIIAVFFGCNTDTENIKLNEGVNFNEIHKIKKKSFNFDKKNSYSNPEETKDSTLNKNVLHQGCNATCCSEEK